MRKGAAILFSGVLLGATVSLATAETIQKGGIRVSFDGRAKPQRLPRRGSAPVTVRVATKISPTGRTVPQLRRIAIAINRHGRLDSSGLPVCRIPDIQPATTAKALEACRGSLVGEGHFSASVALTRQAGFPSAGKLLAFNGTYRGTEAILAHVYGTQPVPTSFTLPFVVARSKGAFATTLIATFPASEDNFVTGIDLELRRTFTYKGKRHSYASAGCPAPEGFPGAVFPFAKATFSFAGGKNLSSTLIRRCKARG